MISESELLKKFESKEDRYIAAEALEKAENVMFTGMPQFTDFMDPYKAHSLKDALWGYGRIVMYGGYAESERLKIGFFSEFDNADEKAFNIVPVEISYKRKFSRELSHRDFLGSVLGLGIAREKTGDIIVEYDRAVIYTDSDIADYIEMNLERVGHTKVNVKILEDYVPPVKETKEKMITLSSLRLDSLLSGAFNISRGRVSELIKGEKAFINWKKTVSPSKNVAEGDLVTLRGTGRVKVCEAVGNTRKGRILVRVVVYK